MPVVERDRECLLVSVSAVRLTGYPSEVFPVSHKQDLCVSLL